MNQQSISAFAAGKDNANPTNVMPGNMFPYSSYVFMPIALFVRCLPGWMEQTYMLVSLGQKCELSYC